MAFWRTRQGSGIVFIVLVALTFAMLDTATKYATTLAPVMLLLWFRYAYMRAPAPVLRPYLYSQIAFAACAGWLVFQHVPDALAWAGIAVIAASGVGNALLTAREPLQRASATPAASASPSN